MKEFQIIPQTIKSCFERGCQVKCQGKAVREEMAVEDDERKNGKLLEYQDKKQRLKILNNI